MRRLTASLLFALAASAAVAQVEPGLARADVERTYEDAVRAAQPDERFAAAVDLADGNLILGFAGGRLSILYRMNFNQVAEGWSWQPQANPDDTDYYRYKFLPLGSREREQGARYVHEDMPGRPREVRRVWHYDYYFTFDNPYDFYPRPRTEDDAGFAAEVTMGESEARELLQPGRIGMVAWGRRAPPLHAESTNFWKATDGKPVDLTLKNRHLIARLEQVWFYDTADGRILARLEPLSPRR